MNASITSKENNVVKFTFQASPEKFEEGLTYSYKKNKGRISMPGFRKGKAPRKLIEASYGEEIFYDDAINFVLNEEYELTIKELELDVVSRPTVEAPKISREEGITFEVSVTVKPEVKLGQYKGLEVEIEKIEVTDDEVMAELKRVQEQNARVTSVTDRPAQLNDIANISYAGKIDGVAFQGGTADNYDLTLGSHSFIDTFEDQIVGHSIGDHFDVNVKFPDEYHDNGVAGKDAVFEVELKDISVKELPELNDEFAGDVSEFETLDEYKANIVDRIKAAKENRAKQAKEDKLIDMAISKAEMDVPQVMIDSKIDQLIGDFANNLKQQGLSLEVYCQYMSTTEEGLRENFKASAERNVKGRLVLEQIAKDENLSMTKEEIDEEIGKMGQGYGITPEKMLELLREEDRKVIEQDMLVRKAMDLLETSAVEVEPIVKVDAPAAE